MSLRRIVKDAAGEDVYLCHVCLDGGVEIPNEADMLKLV